MAKSIHQGGLKVRHLIILLSFLGFSAQTLSTQESYSKELLDLKKRFSTIEAKALAEEFRGIQVTNGKQEGLFPVRTTGVSTKPIAEAATAYLNLLSPQELTRSQFASDSLEWRRWFNVDNGIYVRQGLSLKEMTTQQRAAAKKILELSLSAKGLALSKDIMKTDQTLSELNSSAFLDEQLYYITIMGIPSESEPWGWQLDGHHLVINYFIQGDQVVMTPAFFGAEPAIAQSGKYKGNQVLQEEQNEALKFVQSLSEAHQKLAILERRKPADNMLAGAHKDNLILDYAGLPANKLNADDKEKLLGIIRLFVNNLKEGHAKIRMEAVQKHLDDTWFAWVGDTKDNSVFYYRIHSPVILIEFDHQRPIGTRMLHTPGKPTRDHIHVIVRTPNGNDYGKDLMGQHLAEHHH